MKRADRQDSNYDHTVAHPQSRQPEPESPKEMRQRLATLRSQNTELRDQVQTVETEAAQHRQRFLEEQQRYQSTLTLFQKAQAEAHSYLDRYRQEKDRADTLLVQFETVQTERDQYLTLYNEAQAELKFERRSKASIKGWETRRKRENERLKQEIGEMVVLLRDSMERKDQALNHLEEMANRMDRIQNLVDSVEDTTDNTPVGMVQKFKRIWEAIRDILAE